MATQNPPGSSDPRDLVVNAGNLDRAVNADDATWVDRLGQERPTLKQLETDYPLAGVHAEQASLSQIAAEQAKASAEQSATDAAGKVTEAEAAKNLAVLEADRAEAARDAAFVNADVYSDVATGRAAVATGEQFQVVDGDEIIRHRKTGAGSQVEVARYPAASSIQDIVSRTPFIDVSAISNNYALSFAEAVALVPAKYRRRGMGIAYNGTERLVFKSNYTEALWTTQSRWLRPIDPLAEGQLNLADERMIYRGFVLTLGSVAVYHPDNAIMIIPLHRFYDEAGNIKPLNITFGTVGLTPIPGIHGRGFLTEAGGNAGSNAGTSYDNHEIPANAAYAWFNLQYRTSEGALLGAGNIETAIKHVRYMREDVEKTGLSARGLTSSGVQGIEYRPAGGVDLELGDDGVRAVSRYFAEGSGDLAKGVHIAQVIRHISVQKGRHDLRTRAGVLRKVRIVLVRKVSGVISVGFQVQDEHGAFSIMYFGHGDIDGRGYANVTIKFTPDGMQVYALVDSRVVPEGLSWKLDFNADVHPDIIAAADRISGVNLGEQLTQFLDCGPSSNQSNQSLPAPMPVTLTKKMVNGFPQQGIQGDSEIDHQQTTLIAEKKVTVYGTTNLHAFVQSQQAHNPKIYLLSDTSSVDSLPSLASDLKGRSDSQWIHPDTCYAPGGVGGFQYWMVNSTYPYSSDRLEDAELLVSNDALSWTRIRGATEDDNGGIGLRLPPVYWLATGSENCFLPIPQDGESFEFATQTEALTTTVKGWLNHDPAIAYHEGYVIVYITFNFGLTSSTRQHKYRVCMRTNDGASWEIVREDGSTMPYNETNARRIFTRDGGVRNHIQYVYSPNNVNGIELSPQVVRVSDDEWYLYSREAGTEPPNGVSMNMVRYRGISPYTFDFNSKQVCSKDIQAGGALWHMCVRYYDGVFYTMTNGFMLRSTDGVNFMTTSHPFFWRGMSCDLYKPSFVIGHDGAVKVVQSITWRGAIPHAYGPQATGAHQTENRAFYGCVVNRTIACEFPSLSDIMTRSTTPTADAYVDILVAIISQREKSIRLHFIPGARTNTELTGVQLRPDEEIYAMAFLNSRNGGAVQFGGITMAIPGAALT